VAASDGVYGYPRDETLDIGGTGGLGGESTATRAPNGAVVRLDPVVVTKGDPILEEPFAHGMKGGKMLDKLWQAIAWRVPARLAAWCAYRIIAYATGRLYGDTIVPEVTAMEVMRRWERTGSNKGHERTF